VSGIPDFTSPRSPILVDDADDDENESHKANQATMGKSLSTAEGRLRHWKRKKLPPIRKKIDSA
jgi:hypothetical protein